MTPEERLTKIENLLHTLTENQVQFHVEINVLKESQKETTDQIHALTTQMKALTASVSRVSAAQEATEERLQRLIDHVDRISGRVDKLEQ